MLQLRHFKCLWTPEFAKAINSYRCFKWPAQGILWAGSRLRGPWISFGCLQILGLPSLSLSLSPPPSRLAKLGGPAKWIDSGMNKRKSSCTFSFLSEPFQWKNQNHLHMLTPQLSIVIVPRFVERLKKSNSGLLPTKRPESKSTKGHKRSPAVRYSP